MCARDHEELLLGVTEVPVVCGMASWINGMGEEELLAGGVATWPSVKSCGMLPGFKLTMGVVRMGILRAVAVVAPAVPAEKIWGDKMAVAPAGREAGI